MCFFNQIYPKLRVQETSIKIFTKKNKLYFSDDESGEKAVSVLLSGEESELIFIDHAYADMSPENCISSYNPHGFCVIYSSADKTSFTEAERILQSLWTSENIAQKAVILVGNKADLARSRLVTSEGKIFIYLYSRKVFN